MNMKRLTTLAVLVLLALRMQGQLDPYSSLNMFNKLILNPAYAGSTGELSARLISRWQWAGIANAPRTQWLSLQMPSSNLRHGFGLNAVADKWGHTRSVLVNLNYAYRIPIGTGYLGLGLDFGFKSLSVDYGDITYLGSQDPLIPSGIQNLTHLVVGPGVYYQNKVFYAGLSMPNMLPANLSKLTAVPDASDAKAPAQVYLMGGAAIPAGLSVKIRPSVLVRYASRLPIGLDLGLAAMFKDRILAGFVWKPKNAMVFQLQAYLAPKLQIGYAYDLSLTSIRSYTSGSHEVMLGVDLNVLKGNVDQPVRF